MGRFLDGRRQGHYCSEIMLMSSWYDLCDAFLSKKDFCELVMKCPNKDILCTGEHDMTDDEFVVLQQKAHINLLRDDWSNDPINYFRRKDNE